MLLTRRQKEVLEILKENPTATLNNIAKRLGLNSPGSVHLHIQNLEQLGYIRKHGRKLVVIGDGTDTVAVIPFCGIPDAKFTDYTSGEAILDYLPFPRLFLPQNIDNLFLITLGDDSMLPFFNEGSLLLIEKTSDAYVPEKNDFLLVKFKGKVLFKQVSILQGETSLVSLNKRMFNPIKLTKEVEIIGKHVTLRRGIDKAFDG